MIGLRVTEEFKGFLEELANEENRTLSNFILNATLVYIREKKGRQWEQPEVKRSAGGRAGRKGTPPRKR